MMPIRSHGLLVGLAAVLMACGAAQDGDSFDQTSTEVAARDDATKGAFRHPGVLVSKEQLDFIKAKIAAGAEPWKSAFHEAQSSRFGSLSYKPHAIATVECGPFSTPDVGCSDEQD